MEQRMSTLHIALQEGFTHDDVRIDVAGAAVYHKQDVSTRLQLGLADSFSTDVHDAEVTVHVALPARRMEQHFVVPIHEATYIGISLGREGVIQHRVSATPFGYV